MHTPNCSCKILHQCRGSPKSPPEGQHLYNSYRHAHQQQALGWIVTSIQWIYFYGFCTTQLCTVRLRNMAELGKGKMWTRKIRATCIQADMKRSKHRTQHGLQQCCRSTTPSVSITAVICSLSKDYVFFIFKKSSLSQSILSVLEGILSPSLQLHDHKS